MKWCFFSLILFSIATLTYGLNQKETYNIRGTMRIEWNRHNQLIQLFQRATPSEGGLQFLKEALACCQNAVQYCDTILNDIAQQSKSKRKESWRVDIKEQCKSDKQQFLAEINQLQIDIGRVEANISATALYNRSLEIVKTAQNKDRDCERRLNNNIDAIVSLLCEIEKLYEEAASLMYQALVLLEPYPQDNDKTALRKNIENYQQIAIQYKNEALDLPMAAAAKMNTCKEKLKTLRLDCHVLEEKGLKRNSYELQKYALSLLDELLNENTNKETAAFQEELIQLKESIAVFEKEADQRRLTDAQSVLSKEEFEGRENQRKELFFKSDFLFNTNLFLHDEFKKGSFRIIPLDGQKGDAEGDFLLYTDQFYRFLVLNETCESELIVQVLEEGQITHIEKIDLPVKNTDDWDRYLKNGLVFIPDTKLQAFGLELRLSFVSDPENKFSLILSQKNTSLHYEFIISLKESPLYKCHFSAPSPWQLEALRKPSSEKSIKSITSPSLPSIELKEAETKNFLFELINYPELNQFVEELKKDPLALASFVQNEITLIDSYLHQENEIIYPPSIHRNPLITFLEKQGSTWEQCQLLVYLLRQAGFQAMYAFGDSCSLPKDFVERMLLTKLPQEQKEALLKYPWVLFFDGKEWISLFPWMKEIQVHEGYDLYSFLPDKYATADRWILQYLKGDEDILKHIGPDRDDTAGVLFVRFVEEHLRNQGLSLSDVGIHRTQLKKQFSSWADFPHPAISSQPQLYYFLASIPGVYAAMKIDIASRQNPHKSISFTLPLCFLSTGMSFIRFESNGSNHKLFAQLSGTDAHLELDPSDQIIDISVYLEIPLGTTVYSYKQNYSINKGTSAALCSHFGGDSPKVTSKAYEQFKEEKDEKKKSLALLSFVGAKYFEKCSRSANILAGLHKINPTTPFSFGLAKLAPDLSKGPFRNDEDLTLPQVDMFSFHVGPLQLSTSSVWHQELYTARTSFEALSIIDGSSNEHQILREVFKDDYSVSTVKLLQLAHLEHQKKGLEGEGFLTFTPLSFEAANKNSEAAQNRYFSNLKNVNLSDLKKISPWQWDILQTIMDSEHPLSSWTYAYTTPGLVSSLDGTLKEMGTIIISPHAWYALISINDIVTNGGLGTPLPNYYLTPWAIQNWELVPAAGSHMMSYTLQVPPPPKLPSIPKSRNIEKPILAQKTWSSDIRSSFKDLWNSVADPVDIVSGAFYIDEIDLILPGPFPLTIRRNYNSQNHLMSDLGCGWKLSLNPFLVDQDGKRFAAELDGTVIIYSYNQQNDTWEVFPEDNPELSNFNQHGTEAPSPFHSYIKEDVLYGADGSKRYYENGLLQKWVDVRGNILLFTYKDKRLSRIESSNGDFCGFHHNHQGHISEIYAKDGRRISYDYNSQSDLVKVTLPNTAEIFYEYDRNHRIIRETKPHGRVLENIYDDEGRVKEQRSPMGPQQEMISSARFEYIHGRTIVTDAGGGKTIYQIYDKLIYKIVDPLGLITLQAWFIDKKSWFNPETETLVEWNQIGGAIRSLKSTTDKRGLTISYIYDSKGNPESITLTGEDLTGNGVSNVSKKLIYNDLHLCVQEEFDNKKTRTIYDINFPYLPKRIEKYQENNLISYIDFDYNISGQLVKEDHSGSVILWKYNDWGFPKEKTQVTETEDPDVITSYSYNQQGQCIEIRSHDGTQKNVYDLMGNHIETKMVSSSGKLISATNIGYNLNGDPIWKQTANSENVVYLDYNASGQIKAKRETLGRHIAYTLYDYNPCGYLIKETDPRGYITYRDYDLLGRVQEETKEGHTTLFTYEIGGLIESIISPSGAKLKRHYTTNGLLKEEIFADGSKEQMVYDFLGRIIQCTKNDIAWEIKYDDVHHRITKTHVYPNKLKSWEFDKEAPRNLGSERATIVERQGASENTNSEGKPTQSKTNFSSCLGINTKNTEISEFDAKGNLIRFTDAAGYTSEKTYDGLNRIKTEKTPSGKQTFWSYRDNVVICALPSGETTTTKYSGRRLIQSEVTDFKGTLVASSSFQFDPENDREEALEGDVKTITWKNALGLPVKMEKGEITVKYEYDLCGNCIATIDGDGRVTRQEFDGLGRLTQKQLPDGGCLQFVYDLDSNLIEYHLPNGNVWKASYDFMRRKKSEELLSSKGSSRHWEFNYENGYLVMANDPMQRTHTYLYDSYGRCVQEIVDGSKRTFTYEARGFLTTAEQTTDHSESAQSLVERFYDEDGNLVHESVYLNSILMQQTQQTWTGATRSLQIGNHVRDFIYQNNRLIHVSTQHTGISYSYDLRGALKCKTNGLTNNSIETNASGLPETIVTHLPHESYQEQLTWLSSGKLNTYTILGKEQRFFYNERGYLISAGSENYDFDFGTIGTGIRTEAPGWYVPENGLDEFGKVLASVFEKDSLPIEYNEMGEVTTLGQKKLFWDPWGKLSKVIDSSFSWEAFYDAFGRRLQTRYTKLGEPTLVTNSFYDPEEEFQEIGVQIGEKTFWKIYGPDACDAICDDRGAVVSLLHNGLRQLTAIVSPEGTHYIEKLPSPYGSVETTLVASDLISYAQSLTWQSKAQDPTGFIWMGDRYYDPRGGRFLSQDPVSYPFCLDLYAYANGDPINYFDPNGRFASFAYQITKCKLIAGQWNYFAATLSNLGFGGSKNFQVGSFDLSNGGAIGFINGINNTLSESTESAWQISKYAGGAKIYGTYNATNKVDIDIFECALGHLGLHTTPVELLKKQWNKFIETHGSEEKFLQICHSGGALHVYNALLSSPKSVRDRIICLAIAPAAIIPKKMCFNSYNYMSQHDIVTRLDIIGWLEYGHELQILRPHPDANFFDHDLLSLTFKGRIKGHIRDYIKKYDGKCENIL